MRNVFTCIGRNAHRYIFCLYMVVAAVLLLAACSSEAPKLKPLASDAVIVAFGDSLTYGTGASKETSYPTILAELTGRTVINAGVPGEETTGGLTRINQVLNEYHPQLVILCLGGNDQLRKRDPAQIKSNLKNIIEIILKSGAEVLLVGEPHLSLTLSVPDYYNELGAEMNIPVETASLSSLLRQSDMKSDYIHLNAAGYHAWAEAIATALRNTGALP